MPNNYISNPNTPNYAVSPIEFSIPSPKTMEPVKEEKKATTKETLGMSFDFFKSDEASNLPTGAQAAEQETTTRKKLSRKAPGENIVVVDDKKPLSMEQSNIPYIETYKETNNLLRGAICQADQMYSEIKEDIDTVRASKTLKSKYTYLTNLTATNSAILGTKISAIRELNSAISRANDLDMKRFKDNQAAQGSQNDDSRMMDLYNAFINTPVGSYNPVPSMGSVATSGSNIIGTDMVSVDGTISGSGRPLSPEQNRMRMENNPNIKTVVVYDQSTGRRSFDVIDAQTGQSVPNVPRPDNFLFDDMDINIRTGTARNRTLDTTYPLVLTGGNGDINEY